MREQVEKICHTHVRSFFSRQDIFIIKNAKPFSSMIKNNNKKTEQATSNVREDKKWAAFTMHTHARPKEVGSLSLIVSFTLCLLFASLCRIFWSILRTGDPNKKLLFPKKISSFLSDSKKLKKLIYIVLCPTNFNFLKTTLNKTFFRENTSKIYFFTMKNSNRTKFYKISSINSS